ncbi:MAG TPA: HEAT repeat domain-containing protein [Gemmatimonadaceae bacterium]|nr:HEAT repeat domain-containing protein [Gemmatimonadaceae bacterium]
MTNLIFSSFAGFAAPSTWMLMLLLKATLILVAALGITLVMQQRFSAGARHVVWLVTVSAVLLVPALMAWAPLPVRVLPARSVGESASPTASPSIEFDAAVTSATGPIESGPAASDNSSGLAGVSQAPSTIASMSLVSILMIVWGVVVLAIISSLGFAALTVRRIVRRSQPLDSQDWLAPLWEVSDRLGLEEPPLVVRSEDAKMPFACGLLKPTIVLPAECDDWTLDRRRAVLLHELAHVKRHDLVGHTLGRVACAFYWFHPLVWTAAKKLRSESERACDDLAVSCGARATDYAEHLLDIVTSVRRDATPSVALAMARRKEFEGRMLAILDPELRHSTPSRRQSFALIGSLAMIAMLIGAVSPAPRMAQEPADAAAIQENAAATREMVERDADLDVGDESSPVARKEAKPDAVANLQDGKSVSSVDVATSTAVELRTSVATSIGSATATALSPILEIAASAGRDALIRVLSGNTSPTAQKGSDDRPVLLAKVLLTDPNAELREIAAWGLHEYSDETTGADALATALRRDASVAVREMAAWALHDADGSRTAADALIAALRSDASVDVRAIAAWSLGNMGEESAADALAAALSDASPHVKRRAIWAIGNIEPKSAPRALLAMLGDPDPRTRELVAWTLFQIEDPGAIPALDAALRRETSKELQIAYIKALAAVGEKSVDALRGLLESKDPEIKKVAVRALAGGNATGPWPWPWPEPRPFPR